MTILNNIKKRPDNQKKFFSLVLALVLTFFIVGFWYSFTSDSSVNKKTGESENKLSSVSPWQIIKDEFSKVFSGFNDKVANLESISTLPVEVISDNLATSTGTSTAEIIATSTATTSENIN